MVLFTVDGRQMITCGNDPRIRVFNSHSGDIVGTLEGHQDTVQSLILADDGKRLVSGGNDHSARIWDIGTGRELSRVATTGAVCSLAAAWDRNLLVTGTEAGFVQTWDIRDGRKLAEVKHLDAIESLALDPAGRLLAAGDRSGGIRVWQLNADGAIVPDSLRVWQAHQRITYSLVWASDGSRLISSGQGGRVISWRVAAEAPDTGPFRFTVGNANAFALIPGTDSLLTTASEQQQLIRWDWKSGSRKELLPGHAYNDLRVSPDAKYVAVRRHPAALQVFLLAEISGRQSPATPLCDWNPGGTIRGMQFSPDSRCIAVPFQKEGTADSLDGQTVWLHGSPDFQNSESIPVSGAKSVAFAPDGRRLAVGKDTGLVVWDVSERRAVWESPQTDFSSIVFSPDGKLVVTGGVGRLVIVRDAADGRVRFRMASHRARIDAFAFSPDSRTLATASVDGAIKLWHVPTGQELFERAARTAPATGWNSPVTAGTC